MTRPRITVVLLGALTVASAGCRNEPPFTFAPVEGKVTKGGKPLAGVWVEFHGDSDFSTHGPRSTSVPTDEDGHYQLHSDHGDDGAVVGRHRVCIFDTHAIGGVLCRAFARDADPRLPKGLSEKLPAASPSRVKPSYGRPNETPLRVEVRPGSQVIDLEVK